MHVFTRGSLRILRGFSEQPGAVEDLKLAYKMDACTLVLGNLLEPVLLRHQPLKVALESIFRKYIAPLFASKHPFLRARAAWLAGTFASEVDFTKADGTGVAKGQGPLFDEMFALELRCMKDPCVFILLYDILLIFRCKFETTCALVKAVSMPRFAKADTKASVKVNRGVTFSLTSRIATVLVPLLCDFIFCLQLDSLVPQNVRVSKGVCRGNY
jgi:hypothetical protein